MKQNAPFTTYDVLGVPISASNISDATSTIISWAGDSIGRFVCLRDVASLMAIKDDSEISALHQEAAMILPDGGPIALIGKLRGVSVSRTSGPDLLEAVCERSASMDIKHYFYGGKSGVAEQLARSLKLKYPGLKVAGTYSPPFGDLDRDTINDIRCRISDSGAHIIWVGLSSPKQDVWMAENYTYFSSTLIGVGAAFDFHTGAVKRAPVWMRNLMLEWAYRLMSEPRRLWRRYLILAPRFIFEVITRKG